MIKRPLLIPGAGAALISLIIVLFFTRFFYPPSDLKPGDKATFECRIYSIEEKENSVSLFACSDRYRLLLTADKETLTSSALKTGNTINAECTFMQWNRARNKGNFDEQKYYRSLGIYQKYKLNSCTVTDRRYSVISEMLRDLRNRLSVSILKCADEESAGMLEALVTGSRAEMDTETRDLFRISGIAHVLAISGLHVSFVGMGLFRLLRKKFRFPFAALFSLLAVAGYVIMSSGSASSLRAFIMMAANLGRMGVGRKYDMISSMYLALTLLLISNPFYITNTGFILSFAAVASVAVTSGPVSDMMNGSVADHNSNFFQRFILRSVNMISVSLAVSAMTLPVIVSMYYEFPLFGPLANVIVLSLMPCILGGSLVGAAAGLFSQTAGRIIFGLPVYLTKAVNAICRIFAMIPGNSVTSGHRPLFNILIYYLILVVFMVLLRSVRKGKRRDKTKGKINTGISGLVLRSVPVFLAYILLIIVMTVRMPEKGLDISFLDVDQGECVFIKNENGNVYLIDAGSATVKDVYEYRIKSALKYKGVQQIDFMIVTHPDRDHVSAVYEMLQESYDRCPVRNLLIPEFEDNETYEELLTLAEAQNIKVTTLAEGVSVNDGNVSVECLHPSEGGEYPGANEGSAVMLLKYGGFRAVFTGDISSEQEMEILKGRELDVDLLDVAHHGSKNSSCREFLEALSPEYACISAGVSNSYGHPHRETVERLEDAGSKIYCTKDNGEIDLKVKTDGSVSVYCMSEEW